MLTTRKPAFVFQQAPPQLSIPDLDRVEVVNESGTVYLTPEMGLKSC
jgi:hypothetical protein